VGRLWIELLRTDPAETFFGVRINVFTSIVVGLLAAAYLVWQRGRPREVIARGPAPAAEDGPAENAEDGAGDGEAVPAGPADEPPSRPAGDEDHRPPDRA
jgi:hypothetical protein